MTTKKAAFGGLAALTLFDIVAAHSALGAELPVKALPPAPSWTGAYVGAHAGYRWGDPSLNVPVPGLPSTTAFTPGIPGTAGTPPTTVCTDFFDGFCLESITIPGTPAVPAVAEVPGTVSFGALSSTQLQFSANSPVFGFQGGYNFQIAPTWLIGLEGDLSWGNGSSSQIFRFQDPNTGVVNGEHFNLQTDWSSSLRLRFGYVNRDWLFYGTGGGVVMRTTFSGWGLSCESFGGCVTGVTETFAFGTLSTKYLVGWTLGGGIERRLRDGWLVRLEYLYADFGKVNFGNINISSFYSDTTFCHCSGSATSTGSVSGTLTTQTVRVGLSKQIP